MGETRECSLAEVEATEGATGKTARRKGKRAKRSKYDAACKRLIARTPVLALILRFAAPEFEGRTLEEIARCIGDVRAGDVSVDEREALPPTLAGMRNEDNSLDDGSVFYDTLFRARLPGGGSAAMTVNVEAQREPDGRYPLTKRALYYGARMLSSQRRGWPSGSAYGRLEKAYSIWVCINFPKAEAGTASSYSIQESFLQGCKSRPPEEYDLLSVVLLCLPRQDDPAAAGPAAESEGLPGMRGFLSAMATVFSPETDAAAKMEALESQLGPEMAGKLEGDVETMCDLEDYAIQIGVERGIKQGIELGRREERENTKLDDIASVMEGLSYSLDEAFRLLKIPKDEQDGYRAKFALR